MIRLGVQLPHFGPHATADGVGAFAERAEQLGFDSLWVGDHVVLPTQTEGDYPYQKGGLPAENLSPFYEALTTLSFVAGRTSRVRLGTSILVAAYRHPVLAAKMLSTLDVLSGGRLVLGLGAGWLPEEFELTGAPDFARRGAVLEEIIAIYDRLWSDRVTRFEGDQWSLREMIFDPLPAQRPRPPLWIGGNAKPALRRAARLGDGWMPILAPDAEGEAKLARLREHLKAFGRDPATFGLEGWLRMHERNPQLWAAAAQGWKRLGAQMVMLYPMYRMAKLDEQIETLRRFKEVAGG